MAARSRVVGERDRTRRADSGPVGVRAALALLLIVGVGVGCGDDGGGGAPRDAGPDGGRLPNVDAGPVRDGGVPDLDGGAPPRRDGGVACDTTTCDPRRPAVAGCEDPDRCRLLSVAPMCEPEVGPSGEGALCRQVDQCAEGLACVERVTGPVCAAVCCPGDDSHCAADERCAEVAVLVDGTPSTWGLCTKRRPCDVFDPGAACEPAEGCYVTTGEGETDCRAAGIAGAGDPCERQNDCAPGLFCGGESASRCVAMCALEGEPTCPASTRCASFSPTTPDGVGLCIDA